MRSFLVIFAVCYVSFIGSWSSPAQAIGPENELSPPPLMDAAAEEPINARVFRMAFAQAAKGGMESVDFRSATTLSYRYVFVGGFLNERMPGYFSRNTRELRARGVPRRSVHYIFPRSDESISENAKKVRSEFEAIGALGPEKLVVIGHSRGACDALAFAIENPRFVRDRVHAIVLIQGPFGGTRLADYVTGDGPTPGRKMCWRDRLILGVAARLWRFLGGRGNNGGLIDLTQRGSHAFWSNLLAEHGDAISIVGPRVYYIKTAAHPSRLRGVKRLTGWYLLRQEGANDGVVTLDNQSLPGLGTVLAVIEAGHSDLTHPFPSRRETANYRCALIDGLLASLRPEQGMSR